MNYYSETRIPNSTDNLETIYTVFIIRVFEAGINYAIYVAVVCIGVIVWLMMWGQLERWIAIEPEAPAMTRVIICLYLTI